MFDQADSCPTCRTGMIFPEVGDGRFFEHPKHRGVFINIPVHYVIPRCDNMDCRQQFFFDSEVAKFWAMLDEELEKHRIMINKAVDRYREKQKR